MPTCSKVRSNGKICERPCAEGQAKDRCSKHKGKDLEETPKALTPLKKEKAPKPGSKKWQEQQGLVASSGGSGSSIIEKNPYALCAVDLSPFQPDTDIFGKKNTKIYYDVLSNYPSKYILKGTPIYTGKVVEVKHYNYTSKESDYVYAYKNFKIEILESKTHNGKGNWGNIEVPVVKNKEDLNKPKASTTTMSINTCIVKIKHIISEISEDDTFDSMFDEGNGDNFFPDYDKSHPMIAAADGSAADPRAILLYNAGHYHNIFVSEKYNSTTKNIDLSHLSDEALLALYKNKMKLREPKGDGFSDEKYARFLLNEFKAKKEIDSLEEYREKALNLKVMGENDY
jgi:hypothetical protein